MEERYHRQALFKPIGNSGQQLINQKHVLILGCGALGTASAEGLVRAGIGKLIIIDRDYVELTNLQRQQLFNEQDYLHQTPKAIAAKSKLKAINSDVTIHAHVMDATNITLEPLLKGVDLIVDATDNFDTRLMLNDLAQKNHIPWIYGSCVGSTGMSFTILPKETPCLQCILDAAPISGATCDSVGIIYPTVQMVVAHQLTEALKILVEDKGSLRSNLVTFDLWNNQYQTIKMDRAKKKSCPSCGDNPSYTYLNYESQTKTEILCGRNTVQIRNKRHVSIEQLANRLLSIGQVKKNDFLVSVAFQSYRVVFFQDGRTLIHGTNSIETAKKIYYQLTG
ncbi:MoeB/ThiF family adenylyltransferase [Ornithinibacillus halophilus]|uniref:Adenylyltransferase and sulfurtransferase n=1 Tax=Ornithinibacillus halophilus TaxID=930117 RepID=A0A1M5FLB5_9BACI|nr:MoeB/ThiF family adenylyltransferase [Ornithinibacillus halophilus]SHF91942.1 adenylyltransferase and sulfurtransferase [Ornithinibacillus halophilus]